MRSDATRGQVALFATCYGNRNEPQLDEDLVAIFEHNGIAVRLVAQRALLRHAEARARRPGRVARLKEFNIPQLKRLVDAGYDIVAPIPSCVLMFKQELPLMFPEDADVQAVHDAHLRSVRIPDAAPQGRAAAHRFQATLGKVSYHVPCHLRVQNIGLKTRDVLKLVPDTTVDVIERCSGHNGTYAREEGVPRGLGEDRPAGHATRRECAAGLLLERLPDGRPPDRKRPERRSPTHTSFAVTAQGLWDLRHASKPERRVAELVSQIGARKAEAGSAAAICAAL